MYRFEDIYQEILNIEDINTETLHQILKLIFKYYLTPKEKVYFRCLELYYQDKKQREISVLLNVDQPNLSAKFSRLRKKLRAIADFLLNAEIPEVLQLRGTNKYEAVLTERQFEVLMYLLAGNKSYHISKHLNVSPVAIHQTVNYLKKKLPSDCLPINFLEQLGSI